MHLYLSKVQVYSRWSIEQLKVGYVIFQKRFRVGAEYQNKLVANQQ